MNTSENRIHEIADLLTASVPEIFETTMGMEMFPAAPDAAAEPAAIIAAAVGFVGEVNGMVHLHVAAAFAASMSERFLAIPKEELTPEMVDDAIGEVGNMIVGSVKSRLCDEGSACLLTIPLVTREEFRAEADERADSRVLAFRGPDGGFVLRLSVQE